jgi:UDP-glucose-4-epimerase GalE
MQKSDIGMLVFSSSSAIYGAPLAVPIPEDHPKQPITPHGASKLMIEQMLGDCGTAFGLRFICLRGFNIAGADPAGESAEAHDQETHLIPRVLRAALTPHETISIFGTDFETPDGSCIRDYVHVSDVADAHVLALQALEDGTSRAALNLCSGAGASVHEVIETARKVTGRHIKTRTAPRRRGDPPVLIGDAGCIRAALGWRPRYSRLEDILETAWALQPQTRPISGAPSGPIRGTPE